MHWWRRLSVGKKIFHQAIYSQKWIEILNLWKLLSSLLLSSGEYVLHLVFVLVSQYT